MAPRIQFLAPAFVVALGLPATAFTQAPDTSGWTCESCPFETGHQADYAVGATYADEDSAYFGNATGYTEKGGYLNLDGDGRYAGEKNRMRWTAEDLGLDSRYAALEAGRPGSYGFEDESNTTYLPVQVFRGFFRKKYRIFCSIFTIYIDNLWFIIIEFRTPSSEFRSSEFGIRNSEIGAR